MASEFIERWPTSSEMSYIKQNLNKSSCFEPIYGQLPRERTYLIGSIVRNATILKIRKDYYDISDIDVLIEGDFDLKSLELPDCEVYGNRVNGIKAFPHDRSKPVEIVPLSYMRKKYETDNLTIREWLRYNNFDINSIAYFLKDESILEWCGSSEAIKEGIIRFNTENDKPHILIPRGIRLSRKLNFRLSDNLKEFIAENYGKPIEENIRWYAVDHKGWGEDSFDENIRECRRIKEEVSARKD